MDLLIGSHALSIDAVLVTSDGAFGQLAGLSIEDWTEGFRQGNAPTSKNDAVWLVVSPR